MKYLVEIAQREDLAEILHLQKECYLSEAALYHQYDIPPLTQTLESAHREYDNGWVFLKVLHGQCIIASGRAMTEKGTTHIAKLAVKKEYQNQKLGQLLLTELENQLKRCERYELFTGHKSDRNLYLYHKLGYREFKRQRVNDGLTLVYLEKLAGS